MKPKLKIEYELLVPRAQYDPRTQNSLRAHIFHQWFLLSEEELELIGDKQILSEGAQEIKGPNRLPLFLAIKSTKKNACMLLH